MESPLAVLSAAAHYVEQMEQLKLSATVGGSMMPQMSAVTSIAQAIPPVTLLVPCANGLLVPYVQQPGPYYYNLANGPIHPIPPNKLTLSPLSPSSSLSSPHGSLGSAVSSTVSTPTEERHLLLPRISNEELHHKLQLHQTASPTPSTRDGIAATVEGKQQSQFNTATLTQKVVLRRKKPQSNDNIQQSVDDHFRRSLGSNYKDATLPLQPLQSEGIKKVKNNIRRRPHSVFVSEEVDRHFERSLGVEAWQVIQAKRAKLARKTWN